MAKKTFKENPALRFITDEANTDNTDNKQETEKAEFIYNTENEQERKTKRVNLLLQPSIWENVSKIAHMKQKSVNDLVNSVLKDYSETETESISLYNEVFLK